MASFEKVGKRWRAHVARNSVRQSKTFSTKQEARDWAARVELEITGGAKASRVKFGDVLDRYGREVSPSKRGHHWEVARIEKFKLEPIADKPLAALDASDFAAWRDKRSREVAPGTVRREMVLLSAVLSVARREWRLIDKHPLEGVKPPPEPPRRERLPTDDEIKRLLHVVGDDLLTDRARAVHAFRFALETGMRAGEIVGLTWGDVDLIRRVAVLPRTKNGDRRDVPLSSEAVRLLEMLRGVTEPRDDVTKAAVNIVKNQRPARDSVTIFGLDSRRIDAAWRAVRDRAGIKGLTFHDSRAAAATRLSRKLDPLALAKMLGHRNLNMLIAYYYRESAEELAKRLD